MQPAADLANVVRASLRLRPKDDEGDAFILSELAKYVATPRDGMRFNPQAASSAFVAFQLPQFGKVRWPDLLPTLERCWTSTAEKLEPRRIFEHGHAIGERRCRACRGKGHRMFCNCRNADGEEMGWWGNRPCARCAGYVQLCNYCGGGGRSADDSQNETVRYVPRAEADGTLKELYGILQGGKNVYDTI